MIREGEVKNAVPELRRLAEGLLPGNTLRCARTEFERMVKDQIELMIDPDAPSRFRRIERQARTEFNQNFWWRPGSALPERGPEFAG